MKKILFGVPVGLLAVALGAYGWLWYSPAAELPALGGTLREETLGPRTYLSYVPRDLPADAPLLIVLHGATQDGATVRRWTGYEFDVLADEKKLAVVYPDGYEHGWNDCRTQAKHAARVRNVDDVGFLADLIAHLHDVHHTSTTRVFVFGYSNGGHMAYRLAFERPQLIAAIATASANLPAGENQGCKVKGPTPRVMLSAGTADPLVPFDGGEQTMFGFMKRGQVLSAAETAQTFAWLNGLDAPARAILDHPFYSDPTSVTSRTWSRDGKRQVVQYVVENGGHVVPQSRFRFPRVLGKTAGDLDLPRAAVEFFVAP